MTDLVETLPDQENIVPFEEIPRYKEANPLGYSDEILAIKQKEVTDFLNIYKNQSRQLISDILDLTYKMDDKQWEKFKEDCKNKPPPVEKQKATNE